LARAYFATTHWSVVLAAGKGNSPTAREALERLCTTYWYPLYAFIRRQGFASHDAQDLTQSFFARFLEKNYLGTLQREKGRFRSYLLAAVKHFLANEWDRQRTQKRGGEKPTLSLDENAAESRYKLEPRDELTAEKIYERRWALTLLDQVLARLADEFTAANKATQFETLKCFLSGEAGLPTHAQIAENLGMSEEAVKVAVHRLRKRYRALLRAEIAHTVSDPSEIEEEIRYLRTTL
jgi:RNA polymerase sigma-70 factor (ECF subfamily)